MNSMGIFGAMGLVVVGGAMLLIAGMGAKGSLARNGAVGIRTRATQVSDAAWQAGHESAAPVLRVTGLLGLLCAVALAVSAAVWPWGEPLPVGTGVLFAAGYGVTLGGVLFATRRANAAARETHGPPRENT